MTEAGPLVVGDRVRKCRGDYLFPGTVQAVFVKRGGLTRYVVENDEGILHIFSRGDLEPMTSDTAFAAQQPRGAGPTGDPVCDRIIAETAERVRATPLVAIPAQSRGAADEHDWPVNGATQEWSGADYQVKMPDGRWWQAREATSYEEAREHAKVEWARRESAADDAASGGEFSAEQLHQLRRVLTTFAQEAIASQKITEREKADAAMRKAVTAIETLAASPAELKGARPDAADVEPSRTRLEEGA